MTDREMLELAAKAYADDSVVASPFGFVRVIGFNEELQCDVMVAWSPLTDDGDAFRLAVAIKMDISANNDFAQACCVIGHRCIYEEIECNGDALAATRRAITSAAAEIGKEMK